VPAKLPEIPFRCRPCGEGTGGFGPELTLVTCRAKRTLRFRYETFVNEVGSTTKRRVAIEILEDGYSGVHCHPEVAPPRAHSIDRQGIRASREEGESHTNAAKRYAAGQDSRIL
jgi:hypothetical protein